MYAHKKAVTYKYMQSLCNNNIKNLISKKLVTVEFVHLCSRNLTRL